MDHPFHPLLSKITRYEQAERRVSQWESARIEWTVNRLKLSMACKQEIKKLSTTDHFTCEAFNTVVNTFPVYLFADAMTDEPPIHKDQRSIHPLWFKTFRSLPLVQRYESRFEELYKRYPDRPLAMIFPRRGFAQGMVIHNGNWEMFVPPQSSCHVHKGGKKHAMQLVVQPYTALIDHIQTGLAWRL